MYQNTIMLSVRCLPRRWGWPRSCAGPTRGTTSRPRLAGGRGPTSTLHPPRSGRRSGFELHRLRHSAVMNCFFFLASEQAVHGLQGGNTGRSRNRRVTRKISCSRESKKLFTHCFLHILIALVYCFDLSKPNWCWFDSLVLYVHVL